MSVSDGQAANAANFNGAYLSKSTNSTATSQISLNNSDSSSGSAVTNLQRELNAISSYTGKALNVAKDTLPSWASNDIGASTDSLFDRVESIQSALPLTDTQIVYGSATGLVSSSELTWDDTDGRLKVDGILGIVEENNTATGGITLSYDNSVVRVSAASAIYGITPGSADDMLFLMNTASADMTIANESASADASARIVTGSDANFTFQDGAVAALVRDNTASRWRLLGGGGGSGGSITRNTFSSTSITADGSKEQVWVYNGGSSQTLSGGIAPGALDDQSIVEITGSSNTNTITVQHDDSASGIILNGDWVGYNYSKLGLRWDNTFSRFVEIYRNGL